MSSDVDVDRFVINHELVDSRCVVSRCHACRTVPSLPALQEEKVVSLRNGNFNSVLRGVRWNMRQAERAVL